MKLSLKLVRITLNNERKQLFIIGLYTFHTSAVFVFDNIDTNSYDDDLDNP